MYRMQMQSTAILKESSQKTLFRAQTLHRKSHRSQTRLGLCSCCITRSHSYSMDPVAELLGDIQPSSLGVSGPPSLTPLSIDLLARKEHHAKGYFFDSVPCKSAESTHWPVSKFFFAHWSENPPASESSTATSFAGLRDAKT